MAKRYSQLLLFPHGLTFCRALSKNFKKCNIPGVLVSWMEYLTLSTLEFVTTLVARYKSFKRAILHLKKVPTRIVLDRDINNKVPFSSLPMRQLSMQFDEMMPEQKSKLAFLDRMSDDDFKNS